MASFLTELRHIVRMLFKAPVFSIVAILTLGFGIGANTAVFSFVSATLLQTLPLPQPERLVLLCELNPQKNRTRPTVSPPNLKSEAKSEETDKSEPKLTRAALIDEQWRAFAISLVMSLADEARSYRDLTIRARVLASAADTLWEADNDAARTQFRRAWEAAEKADAEEVTAQTKDSGATMVIAFGSLSGGDLRSQVLTLAARRDRALGEEFLRKLTDDTNREAEDGTRGTPTQTSSDSWSTTQAASKRLLLARRLLDDDQIERALEFAAPVLNQVNRQTIGFLGALRTKRPELADQRFVLLLAQVELDPSSDANAVSGLSSYAFTPGLYVTFSANGGVSFSPAAAEPIAAPDLPGAIRRRFFQVAGSVLLRPLLPPDQDVTSAGRTGKYMVIKRLLPLFDQYAPDTAIALRSLLTALTAEPSIGVAGADDFLLREGIQPEANLAGALEKMQDQLDHAKTSRERDAIYTDAAAALATQGDARAQDLADKIDNAEWRAIVRQYVDLCLVQFALRKKDVASVTRLAKAGVLSHTQRAWVYTQAARLLMNSGRSRALELLDEALAEARRIETDDPNRAHMLIGVATQFFTADHLRAWEIMGEAVKAANAVEEFSGEDVGLNFALATASGLKFIEISGSEFSLTRVMRLLTKSDLIRANDLAKSFKNDAPRASATLAIATAVFEKRERHP